MLVAPLNPRFPLTTRRTQRCCTATKISTRKLLINRRKLATRILGEATSIPNEKHWKLIDLTCNFIRTMWVKLLTQSYDETNDVKFLAELLFQQQSTCQTLHNLFRVAMVGPHQFQVYGCTWMNGFDFFQSTTSTPILRYHPHPGRLDASGMVSQLQLWYDSALRSKKTSSNWLTSMKFAV